MKYSVIVPVYNEQEVIDESCRRLCEVMDSTGESYELIFVNDGSRDSTHDKLCELEKRYKAVKYLCFSRNFGHQTAITAGMDASVGEAVLIIDADLQDPPEVMLEMIERWKQGFNVVYGKRVERKGETRFKLLTAALYYRFMSYLSDGAIPENVGDFRLIDRRVCDELKAMPEHNRYVRGMISWIGYSQTSVEYIREPRFAGKTKYSLKKMLKLAGDGITSFSYKPLKLTLAAGMTVLVLSALALLILLIAVICGKYISGLYFVGGAILFVNGLILIGMGITGEYVGRICDEVKNRPRYIIAERHGFE